MNLYSSFGNLLESWVTNGEPHITRSGPQLGNALEDEWEPGYSGDTLTISEIASMCKPEEGPLVQSDVEDSGVEMASSEASLPSSPYSITLGKTDSVPLSPTTGKEQDGLPSSSPPCSPVFSLTSSCSSSSSSPFTSISHLGPRDVTTSNHPNVEEALRRTDTGVRQQGLRPPRRRSHTASLPPASTAASIQAAGNRSARAEQMKSFSLSTVDEQSSPELLQHRDTYPFLNTLPAQEPMEAVPTQSEDMCEGETAPLSPGLGYLEQVCRMLEEIARLQRQNQVLQMEMEALQQQQASQKSEHDHRDCRAIMEGGQPAHKTLEVKDDKELPCQASHNSNHVPQYFRRRSASDTRLMKGHLRKEGIMSRGQYLNEESLFEQPDDDVTEQVKEESGKKKKESKTKTLRLKSFSLRRDATLEKTSQQINSSTKKATGNQLTHLFRRRKTVTG
ncbi:hypothetical protein UPYG_G00283040 [Umbra pygmaea]|uniref:DUF4657 domain-containing protein n=1 Tax=Umbra pygmaea TaxID=75934 RepID=A0ABD0W7W1_UMBPY